MGRSIQQSTSLRMVVDLVPMFVAATAIRSILGTGLTLHGNVPDQVLSGSVLAAAANNLPAAAAIRAVGAGGRWGTILAMSIGPNLLLWGSVATLICRRIARESGLDLSPVRFTLLGLALVPIQLAGGLAALHVAGVL